MQMVFELEIDLPGFKSDLEEIRVWYLANKARIDNLEKTFHTFTDKKEVRMNKRQKEKTVADAIASVEKLKNVIIPSMEVHLGLKEEE